jgi:hypothetical protein
MGQFDLLVSSRPSQPTTTSHEGGTVHTVLPNTLLRLKTGRHDHWRGQLAVNQPRKLWGFDSLSTHPKGV